MPHKYTAVLMFAALALGVLLLFGLGGDVSATTIKLTYTSGYDCGGGDDTEGTADDSCSTAGLGGRALGATADVETVFDIRVGHSNYANTRTILASPAFNIAADASIPNGAYVGSLTSQATISLLGAACISSVPVNFPMYDATTDNTNTIDWTGTGINLTQDSDGNGLADAIDKYPSFLNIMFNNQKPLARYYGYTVPTGTVPKQLNFVIFAPGVLQGTPPNTPGMPQPDQGLNASLGYINYVALDNPAPGQPTAPQSVTDICTPLNTTTRLLGRTAGEGRTIAPVGNPELSPQCAGALLGTDQDGDTVADDGCTVVTDRCDDAIDNDGDTKLNEYCVSATGVYAARVRSTNPTSATSGVYGTGSHLVGAYLQGGRDADADGLENTLDSCPTIADGRESGAACAAGNVADEDGDTKVNDGCPRIGTAETFPTPDQCGDALDNDGDTLANDGCPVVQVDADGDGLGAACDPNDGTNNLDQDGDTFTNRQDNCPLVANVTQLDLDSNRCANNTSDDGADESPARVNDGCPAVGAPETACTDALDNDGDTLVNDGCPLRGAISESCVVSNGDWGPCSDAIGDACDANPTAVDGDYDKDMPRGAVCIGAADTDGDGWCDATEALLGPGGNAIGDSAVAAEVPEYTGLDYPMVTGAPQSCSNLAWYASAGDAIGDGATVDDDGDTLINAADTNCAALALDTDQDGVPDASDNCVSVYNPDQTNTDTLAIGGGDASGDACDLNDDGDGLIDSAEWARGSDARNPFSPFLLDLDGNGTIQGADASALKAWIGTSVSVVPAPSQVCLP